MALVSNEKSPLSTSVIGLKKVKLSIDKMGDENSLEPGSSWLLKEKPPDAEQGVLLLTRKEENDDVGVGECPCCSPPVTGNS